MSLLERLEYVKQMRGLTLRKWATDAGLTPLHISQLMSKLRNKPGSDVTVGVLRKIAVAARVDLHWLITGEGSPDYGQSPDVPLETEYPTRAQAALAARLLGFSDEAIASVYEITGLSDDPGARFWMAEIEATDRRRSLRVVPAKTEDATS